MCDICKRHGDGGKWYLNPKNYGRELEEARREYLERLAGRTLSEYLVGGYELGERLRNTPLIGKLLVALGDRYYGGTMGGQIVPLQDLLQVLDLCQNPSILPCECRKLVGEEGYQCLNMGMLPQLYQKANPDEYVEELTLPRARKLLTEWDEKGFYHLILWTRLPYVTTVCNCTAPTCTAYKGRRLLGFRNNMLKGEYVAYVDPERCTGCKACLTRCPFGAMRFNLDAGKAFVEINNCFGCGLCASGCKPGAVKLMDRRSTPARALW